MVPTNQELGIANRQYVSSTNRAWRVDTVDLETISEPLIRCSLQAQALFGLRVEESLKIQPHTADAGNALYLKGSWTKGGRERMIPILTTGQRQWLEAAKKLICQKGNSLIPSSLQYKTYRKHFDYVTLTAGIKNKHGLRHQYAQHRYKTLTGWKCPAQGGPKSNEMDTQQRSIDKVIRLQISAELGHSRRNIMRSYLDLLSITHNSENLN
jgi:hypothetical protein